MEGNSVIVFEVIVSAILPLGFGFWQLWSLRREKRRDAEKALQTECGKPPDDKR